ncbi:unnamed protein product [Oppiella nova]|uniref:MD-2-related lipid-recognition domain-containing protein n=1 Tax=Oppiella nova TaxID=334625 RepID=A0A7R9LWE4_9ACAR|nr:unnamed protein product [Oppiella nova]CAG2167329.1 unnamed protein product [Oppiella nova]
MSSGMETTLPADNHKLWNICEEIGCEGNGMSGMKGLVLGHIDDIVTYIEQTSKVDQKLNETIMLRNNGLNGSHLDTKNTTVFDIEFRILDPMNSSLISSNDEEVTTDRTVMKRFLMSYGFFIFFVVSSLIAIILTITIGSEYFKNDVNTVSSIDITPCDAEPCVFTRGTSVSVTAPFTPVYEGKIYEGKTCNLEMKALLGSWYPISDEYVCQTYLDCPLKPGVQSTLNYKTLVDQALPAGETLTRWKLICDSGATEIFCADITINIK